MVFCIRKNVCYSLSDIWKRIIPSINRPYFTLSLSLNWKHVYYQAQNSNSFIVNCDIGSTIFYFMYPTIIACALVCYLAMLNSYIWGWGFPLPHALPCVLIYWFVNIQFWFCKWCHELWGSETLKPINRVMRKQDCRSLRCYLTFALTMKHFRNKQAIYLWLWKLQADSKSCLISYHPHLTHCQCGGAASPHSGTQDHSCLSAMW